MPTPPKTKHFNVYTGYAPVETFYQALQEIAARWERCGITQVRTFHAGVINVYVSITAQVWYHCSYADDPDWHGDAQDPLTVHRLQCRDLARAPHPERTWLGHWRQFTTAAELHSYAAARLQRLAAMRAQPATT